MIEISHLTKRYGRRTALASLSLTIYPGEVTLLLGANGAGKSTLLRCLLGITDFEGEISVFGHDPLTNGPAVRSLVGYMPQSGGLHLDMTVAETMAFYAAIRRAPQDRCAGLLEEAGLAQHHSTRVGELSGGMRQRLGFAVALLTDPKILVLDEPSASLDAASREWLADRLGRGGGRGTNGHRVHTRRPRVDGRRSSPHPARRRACHPLRPDRRCVAVAARAAAPRTQCDPRPGEPARHERAARCDRQPMAGRLRPAAWRPRSGRDRDGARQHVRPRRCRHSAAPQRR